MSYASSPVVKLPVSINTDAIPMSHKIVFSGLSGAIATTCIYPLDIVKTKLMNQATHRSSPLEMARCILRSEGLRGFYRGWPPNVLFVMPEKALKLTMNDYFRKTYRGMRQNKDLPFWLEMAAGGSAGLCQVIATNPMELLKIQGATMNDKIRNGQLKQAISYPTLVRSLGVSGMYTGVLATILRDVPFSMVYFSLYSQAKSFLCNGDQKASGINSFAAGAIAGTTAAALTCPLDVIKTRVHANVAPQKLNFASFLRREGQSLGYYYRDIVNREGHRALMKGIVPRCLIISPLFAITMFCYEEFQALIG